MTLNDLETGFVYQSDGKVDSWRILTVDDLRGDCDDFACTALYIATGSLWPFWVALIFGSAKIHYVTTTNGVGHAVLQYEGLYIDNWSRKYVTKHFMEDTYGHQFSRWMFIWPQTAIKMVLGKLKG